MSVTGAPQPFSALVQAAWDANATLIEAISDDMLASARPASKFLGLTSNQINEQCSLAIFELPTVQEGGGDGVDDVAVPISARLLIAAKKPASNRRDQLSENKHISISLSEDGTKSTSWCRFSELKMPELRLLTGALSSQSAPIEHFAPGDSARKQAVTLFAVHSLPDFAATFADAYPHLSAASTLAICRGGQAPEAISVHMAMEELGLEWSYPNQQQQDSSDVMPTLEHAQQTFMSRDTLFGGTGSAGRTAGSPAAAHFLHDLGIVPQGQAAFATSVAHLYAGIFGSHFDVDRATIAFATDCESENHPITAWADAAVDRLVSALYISSADHATEARVSARGTSPAIRATPEFALRAGRAWARLLSDQERAAQGDVEEEAVPTSPLRPPPAASAETTAAPAFSSLSPGSKVEHLVLSLGRAKQQADRQQGLIDRLLAATCGPSSSSSSAGPAAAAAAPAAAAAAATAAAARASGGARRTSFSFPPPQPAPPPPADVSGTGPGLASSTPIAVPFLVIRPLSAATFSSKRLLSLLAKEMGLDLTDIAAFLAEGSSTSRSPSSARQPPLSTDVGAAQASRRFDKLVSNALKGGWRAVAMPVDMRQAADRFLELHAAALDAIDQGLHVPAQPSALPPPALPALAQAPAPPPPLFPRAGSVKDLVPDELRQPLAAAKTAEQKQFACASPVIKPITTLAAFVELSRPRQLSTADYWAQQTAAQLIPPLLSPPPNSVIEHRRDLQVASIRQAATAFSTSGCCVINVHGAAVDSSANSTLAGHIDIPASLAIGRQAASSWLLCMAEHAVGPSRAYQVATELEQARDGILFGCVGFALCVRLWGGVNPLTPRPGQPQAKQIGVRFGVTVGPTSDHDVSKALGVIGRLLVAAHVCVGSLPYSADDDAFDLQSLAARVQASGATQQERNEFFTELFLEIAMRFRDRRLREDKPPEIDICQLISDFETRMLQPLEQQAALKSQAAVLLSAGIAELKAQMTALQQKPTKQTAAVDPVTGLPIVKPVKKADGKRKRDADKAAKVAAAKVSGTPAAAAAAVVASPCAGTAAPPPQAAAVGTGTAAASAPHVWTWQPNSISNKIGARGTRDGAVHAFEFLCTQQNVTAALMPCGFANLFTAGCAKGTAGGCTRCTAGAATPVPAGVVAQVRAACSVLLQGLMR
jgi:hypothetical protein